MGELDEKKERKKPGHPAKMRSVVWNGETGEKNLKKERSGEGDHD